MYTLENVPLFEAMYGPGLISLGGYEAVDRMFSDLDISEKKILDVGSGIGGMAHYLANKYNAFVTGLEIYPWMAEYALANSPSTIKNKVNFITYSENGNIPLPEQSFDIIYSKGVLTNVQDKHTLFNELFRLLKPSGTLCLMDWIVPEARGPLYEELSMGDMSFKETESSYKTILSDCGFKHICFKNENEVYLTYVKNLTSLLASKNHKEQFTKLIDDSLREELLKSNLYLQTSIENGDQISTLIRASK